ncbi:MAG: hypothetical protein RL354_923, partial [Planctomycetota bacterium]
MTQRRKIMRRCGESEWVAGVAYREERHVA